MSPLHGEKFLLPVPRASLYGYVARRYRAARSPPPCRLSSPCSAPVCKGLSAVPSLKFLRCPQPGRTASTPFVGSYLPKSAIDLLANRWNAPLTTLLRAQKRNPPIAKQVKSAIERS